MRKRAASLRPLIIGFFVFIIGFSASAQATCPASVILALARAGSACLNVGRDQACYGNGTVSAIGFDGSELFAQTGDVINAEDIQTLTVGGGDEYSVASIKIQASLGSNDGRDLTLLAFGDVTIQNLAPPTPELLITATGTLNIREFPTDSAPILAQIGVRDSLNANGRTPDNAWLRVIVAGERGARDLIGWVSSDSITTSGNLLTLTSIADPSQPYIRPFQVMNIQSSENDAPCEGTTESGVLIQSPSVDVREYVDFTVNERPTRLAGTMFVQTVPTPNVETNSRVWALDGEALLGDVFLPAGTRYYLIGLNLVEPYERAEIAALPINNLPVRFAIPEALTTEAYEAALAVYQARSVTPTPPPPDPTLLAACQRTIRINADLRAGPGTNYEIVNSISADTRVYPVIAAEDLNGLLWYQLQNSNWISADLVEESGLCEPVPTSSYSEAPTSNVLSLETCGTSNGPIRAGQLVTIEFVPPAFDNLYDAQRATSIDPGRITVENRRQTVRASQPQSVGGERYVRVFSTIWRAATGTYRITGDRLSYEVICDVVVSVG